WRVRPAAVAAGSSLPIATRSMSDHSLQSPWACLGNADGHEPAHQILVSMWDKHQLVSPRAATPLRHIPAVRLAIFDEDLDPPIQQARVQTRLDLLLQPLHAAAALFLLFVWHVVVPRRGDRTLAWRVAGH